MKYVQPAQKFTLHRMGKRNRQTCSSTRRLQPSSLAWWDKWAKDIEQELWLEQQALWLNQGDSYRIFPLTASEKTFLSSVLRAEPQQNKLCFGTAEAQSVFTMPLSVSASLSPHNALLLHARVLDSACPCVVAGSADWWLAGQSAPENRFCLLSTRVLKLCLK